MASKQIQSKSRTPRSLVYNAWVDVDFGINSAVSAGPGSTQQMAGLGLNNKFTHFTYTVGNTVTPGASLVINIVSGAVTANPPNNTSYGWVDLGGTFAIGDTITVTVAGISTVTRVTSRTPDLKSLASAIVANLNYNTAFNALYVANSLGGEFVLQPLAYGALTPAYSVSVVSASGTATAGGATMVAGTVGTNPNTQPVSDQTSAGIVPSPTVVTGNALFPVDIILPTFASGQAGLTGSVYAYRNFDAIWPANSTITLTTANNGPLGGSSLVDATLNGVIVDNHPMSPADSNGIFELSPFVI